MIRTEVVTLTAIPATAYRRKLKSGGSGIVILRADSQQPGIASISKKTGEPVATRNTPAKLFPKKAFREAIELTAGLPYRKRSAPSPAKVKVQVPEEEAEPVYEIVIDSREYEKLVERYTDKGGKLSYDLLDRGLIKFAHTSSRVRAMVAGKAPLEDIRLYVVASKFRSITGNRELSDDQVLKMAELLDEVSPRGVFKTLNEELQRKLQK